MHHASLPLVLTMVVSLAACPPTGQDPETTSGPESSSSVSGSNTSDSTPSAGSTDPTSTGSSTTGADTDGATTSGEHGTTQPVDTTGSDTTGGTTTGGTTTGLDTGDTTTGTSTSTGETGDTTGLPDTTGGEVCEAGPQEVDVEWSLEVPPELAGQSLTLQCKLVSVQEVDFKVAVNFTCIVNNQMKAVVLHYALQPHFSFMWQPPEDEVEILYRTELGAWTNEWLRITSDFITFYGVHADQLNPPDIAIKEFYGRDVKLGAPCDPKPDPCGQRQSLEVSFEHYSDGNPTYVSILDGEKSEWGFPVGSSIWLEHATRLLEPIGCDDVAPVWLDFAHFIDYSGF